MNRGTSRPVGRRAVLAGSAACLAGCAETADVVLRGAGATLPQRLYAHWIARYAALVPGVRVDYQAVGSASGLRQLFAHMADFGASDAPARGAPFALLHVPTSVVAVALAHRLPGLARPLVLGPTSVAAIFDGRARRWSDASIADDNPGLALPDLPIVPIFRSDGSGATQILREWLGETLGTPRRGMLSHFPAGIGARGSHGVAHSIARVPGALGYVEVEHARAAQLGIAEVAPRDGAPPVAPSDADVDRAARSLPLDVPLTTPLGSVGGGYPLASFTYLVVPRDMVDDGRSSALARFLFWVLGPGQDDCAELGYRPLPAVVSARARRALVDDLTAGSRPALRAD